MKSNTLCDVMHDNHDKFRMISHRLATLAYHFEEVGNEAVGRKLRDINEEIREAADAMLKAWSDDLQHQFQASIKCVGDTLSTMLECRESRGE